MSSLLAVDVGIKTGLALYGRDGKLLWYRSHNFGSTPRLRRGVPGILKDIPDISRLILEGGGILAEIWEREAERRSVPVRRVTAEEWRRQLLYQREQRSGRQAKQSAGDLARKIIAWSGASLPTSLRHDTAEAILTGFWAVIEMGWLEKMPQELKDLPTQFREI